MNRTLPNATDSRWAAVIARDKHADGEFYYSVRTTGVYCRPSCPARLPRPENVTFYTTRAEAEAAGFRPCKRCRPEAGESLYSERVARVCRFIADSDTPPRLEELAAKAEMSPSHFHRVFKSITGLTPRAYAAASRSRRVQTALRGKGSVTDAIYDAGYASHGRFYAESDRLLGMTPTAYRAGGLDAQIHFAIGQCTLGEILVAQTARGVCAILMGDDPAALVRALQDQFPHAELIGGDKGFEETVAKVIAFVEAPGLGLDLPLDIRGTAFQRRVWEVLCTIPAGTTWSYADVAAGIGSSGSARAVAQACASNVLAVAIPCHRVVRNDGSLSGYRWGVERKKELLNREARISGANSLPEAGRSLA